MTKTIKAARKSAVDANHGKDQADAFCIGWTNDELAVLLASMTKTPPKKGVVVTRQQVFDAAKKAGLSRTDLKVTLSKAKGLSTTKPAARGETKIADGADAKQVDKAKLRAENATLRKGQIVAAKKTSAKPEKATGGGERYGVTPESVLARIKAEKGCQVGVIREWFVENDRRGFGSLAPTQQRGLIRRAIRALEADKLVTKDGATYLAKGATAKAASVSRGAEVQAAAARRVSKRVVAKGGRK